MLNKLFYNYIIENDNSNLKGTDSNITALEINT